MKEGWARADGDVPIELKWVATRPFASGEVHRSGAPICHGPPDQALVTRMLAQQRAQRDSLCLARRVSLERSAGILPRASRVAVARWTRPVRCPVGEPVSGSRRWRALWTSCWST